MTMTEELISWSWEQKCRKAVAALETNGFTAVYCAAPQAAADYILQQAADAHSVGFGGSMTIAGLGVSRNWRPPARRSSTMATHPSHRTKNRSSCAGN